MRAREMLNKLKWTCGLDGVTIWYVHRGAPGDTMTINGEELLAIGRSFIEAGTVSIPYHRIFKIARDGDVVWERER